MSGNRKVRIDSEQCTGCAECVELCEPGAISIVDDKAHVDEELCNGCLLCVDGCPEGAVHPVLYGEIVRVEDPAPISLRPKATLIETAEAAATVAGVSLVAKTAGWLARVIERWLVERSFGREEPREIAGGQPSTRQSEGRVETGRRARHRRRGA